MTDRDDSTAWYSGANATLGDRLTAARETQGLSQADLARRLGVRLKTIEAWENDASEPRANRLQMLAGLTNVSIRWLMTGEGDGVDAPLSLEDAAADAQDLLADMQTMSAQMQQLATRMGRSEKRLRLLLREAI